MFLVEGLCRGSSITFGQPDCSFDFRRLPMRLFRLSGLTALSLLCLTSLAAAGEVKVKTVHLCCGGCVSAVTEALEKVPGVSGGAANQDDGTVTFQATDAKAATAGLKAIAGA